MSSIIFKTPPDREGLSVSQACEIAGIGRTTLYEALASGELAARKIGRRLIILRSDLSAWMAALPRFQSAGRQV